MPRPRTNPKLAPRSTTNVNPSTNWQTEGIDPKKIPYVSHTPKNPINMTPERKARIQQVIKLKNEGKSPEEIAIQLKTSVKNIKRDLTAAIVLVGKSEPYLEAEDRKLVRQVVNTYNEEAKGLFLRVKKVIGELEEAKTYLNGKDAIGYAMILSELRQTLELGAKLSGELQTGTQVNVIVFSSLVKRLIEIISQEVDKTTFLRIRERFKLEVQGQKPLGDKGGAVEIEDGEIIE